MNINNVTLVAFLFLSFVTTITAQFDAHYWTHQYGAKGLLLNGAVIASSDDETNIFYNPGALGLDNNLGFAFSFLSPTYASLMANNFLVDKSQLTDSGFNFSPGFLAIRLKPFKSKKITLALASFERFKSNIQFKDRITGPINQTGLFLLRADINFSRKISEDWFAMGLAYNITKNLGIGISQYSTWHSQNLDFFLKKEVLLNSSPQTITASWRNEVNYSISTYSGFISKIGISYCSENFNIGATYTSPTYGILRSSVNYSLDDQRINPNEELVSVVSNRNDIELENYKTPASIGFGLEIHAEKLCYSASAEYFFGIQEYVMFRDIDDPFDGYSQVISETEINLITGNQSVLNFAFGLQYEANPKLTWVGGFRTDYNENTSLLINNSAQYLGLTPNVFHISGGGMFRRGNNTFSIGMDFGYGRREGGTQLANFDNVNIDNLYTFSGKDNVNNQFFSVMLFLTYDFIFKNYNQQENK